MAGQRHVVADRGSNVHVSSLLGLLVMLLLAKDGFTLVVSGHWKCVQIKVFIAKAGSMESLYEKKKTGSITVTSSNGL